MTLELLQQKIALWHPAQYKEKVADLFSQFLILGPSEHHGKLPTYFDDQAAIARAKLNAAFPGGESGNKRSVLDRVSLIKKYHQIYYGAQFPFGMPDNFLGPQKVVQIYMRKYAKDIQRV